MGHKDLRLGQIVYILVFCNMSFSRLLPLDGFQFIFLLRDSENDIYTNIPQREGITTVCHAYEEFHQGNPPVPARFLSEMLSLILN